MKKNDLVRHLLKNGCVLVREGARHSVFAYILTGRSSSVPRHREVNNFTAKKICRDLGINEP